MKDHDFLKENNFLSNLKRKNFTIDNFSENNSFKLKKNNDENRKEQFQESLYIGDLCDQTFQHCKQKLSDFMSMESNLNFSSQEEKNKFSLKRDFFHLNINLLKFIGTQCKSSKISDLTPSLEDYITHAKSIRQKYLDSNINSINNFKLSTLEKNDKKSLLDTKLQTINNEESILNHNPLLNTNFSRDSELSFSKHSIQNNKNNKNNEIETPITFSSKKRSSVFVENDSISNSQNFKTPQSFIHDFSSLHSKNPLVSNFTNDSSISQSFNHNNSKFETSGNTTINNMFSPFEFKSHNLNPTSFFSHTFTSSEKSKDLNEKVELFNDKSKSTLFDSNLNKTPQFSKFSKDNLNTKSNPSLFGSSFETNKNLNEIKELPDTFSKNISKSNSGLNSETEKNLSELNDFSETVSKSTLKTNLFNLTNNNQDNIQSSSSTFSLNKSTNQDNLQSSSRNFDLSKNNNQDNLQNSNIFVLNKNTNQDNLQNSNIFVLNKNTNQDNLQSSSSTFGLNKNTDQDNLQNSNIFVLNKNTNQDNLQNSNIFVLNKNTNQDNLQSSSRNFDLSKNNNQDNLQNSNIFVLNKNTNQDNIQSSSSSTFGLNKNTNQDNLQNSNIFGLNKNNNQDNLQSSSNIFGLNKNNNQDNLQNSSSTFGLNKNTDQDNLQNSNIFGLNKNTNQDNLQNSSSSTFGLSKNNNQDNLQNNSIFSLNKNTNQDNLQNSNIFGLNKNNNQDNLQNSSSTFGLNKNTNQDNLQSSSNIFGLNKNNNQDNLQSSSNIFGLNKNNNQDNLQNSSSTFGLNKNTNKSIFGIQKITNQNLSGLNESSTTSTAFSIGNKTDSPFSNPKLFQTASTSSFGITQQTNMGGFGTGLETLNGNTVQLQDNGNNEDEVSQKDQEEQAKQLEVNAVESTAYYHQMCGLYYKKDNKWKIIGRGVVNLIESISQDKQVIIVVRQSPSTNAKILMNLKFNNKFEKSNILEPSGICFVSAANPPIANEDSETYTFLLKFKNKDIRIDFENQFNQKFNV